MQFILKVTSYQLPVTRCPVAQIAGWLPGSLLSIGKLASVKDQWDSTANYNRK